MTCATDSGHAYTVHYERRCTDCRKPIDGPESKVRCSKCQHEYRTEWNRARARIRQAAMKEQRA